ncbi:glycoside hydrolase family 5 protein [Serpula lacrymans var. lacrymans S7.3]|uniref:mannan endo-1,4-beta-mannosidase n=2 Tax=Serpula lacrymans var. lacrymans TaxID=341189 RepID=F8PVA3_SERL3|nr:glycoside hydrolase family 5 protein [Serpula lacrymans var. lacrymans S7.9]EGN99795.1 glycoside hydrolase family 5 protein [Serpula lacrymans var. lacrymans S7.3]EGO25367.1 glycoside hydrolase family 5 protein [Serpula lacrymans var. lacrymans S7.9]
MTLCASLVTLALAAASYANPVSRANTGYVQASGQGFTLNGEPYTVFGSNSYWVGLTELDTTDMDTTFANIAATGGTTVRTWGFNDVTTASGDYYQLWDGSTATINYGATGLENFDNVVAAAAKYNIRLIVTLTNNWDNYGGMDVYVDQILGEGQPHDYFYTNSEVIAAYQNYVKAFVSRYLTEPTIFGWELANEPRCTGSTNATSGTCTTTTITEWIKTMSAYIKSIDTNHLVGLGDEGWFNDANSTDYAYDGSQGIDFNANLAVDTIDFGTFHVYPFTWGEDTDPIEFGTEWIENHRDSQATYNKPVLMEEFGVFVDQNQTETYENWYSTVIDGGLAGVLIWQAGSNLTNGATPDDGFAIYPNTTIYYMEQDYSAQLKARNDA